MTTPANKGKQLKHGRYQDGRTKTVVYNTPSTVDFRVGRFEHGRSVVEAPIPLNEMRAVLASEPERLQLLNKRIEDLQSLISLDFDSGAIQVAALHTRRARNGSRYLNEVMPCYCYLTLMEHSQAQAKGGFRAANGEESKLRMPLYLTWDHALSSRKFLHYLFTELVNVSISKDSSRWHDLWVPDMVAHLINQAIVDFSKGKVSDTGIQFVLDALRLMVFCCEAPSSKLGGVLLFPNMVPLMRNFLLGFVYHPEQRTRDKIPDLGDLLQWLSVLELLDNSLTWKDLVHAVIVDFMRRIARWVSSHIVETNALEPQVRRVRTGKYRMVPDRRQPGKLFKLWLYEDRRETRSQMLLRFLQGMTRKDLLDVWWQKAQVGGRVVMYSHAFYAVLVEGRGLQMFKDRYDPVLGAAYPADVAAIKTAKEEIEDVGCLGDMFARLGYPMEEEEIYRLCLWAIEAQEGYHRTKRADTLEDGWKASVKPVAPRGSQGCRQPNTPSDEAGPHQDDTQLRTLQGEAGEQTNRFSMLGLDDDDEDGESEEEETRENTTRRRPRVFYIPGS